MAFLRHLHFWPDGGFVDPAWSAEPDEDAFARTARGVAELYSEGLAAQRIANRVGVLQLNCWPHEPGRTEVAVTVFTGPEPERESACVLLPDGVAALSPPARAALVLDVFHAAALLLGEARGWDRAALEAARAHAVRHDLRFTWHGPEKLSPNRRLTARPVFTVADDGSARLVVEIRRAADGVRLATGDPLTCAASARWFREVARTLRWHGSDRVTVDAGTGRQSVGVQPLPRLTAAPYVTPPILVNGGLHDDAMPDAYGRASHLLVALLETPPWVRWWSAAPGLFLEVGSDEDADAPARVTARRTGATIRVRINRPPADALRAGDPIALALADVTAAAALARDRAGLGPHPALPALTTVTDATQAWLDAREELVRRARLLLDRLADRLPARHVQALRDDLDSRDTGPFLRALRIQLAHLRATVTPEERAEFDELHRDEMKLEKYSL